METGAIVSETVPANEEPAFQQHEPPLAAFGDIDCIIMPEAPADPLLKSIGMIALGCFIGFAVTAAAFLSLDRADTFAPAAYRPDAMAARLAEESKANNSLPASAPDASQGLTADVQLLLARRAQPAQPPREQVSEVAGAAIAPLVEPVVELVVEPVIEYDSGPAVEYASGPGATEGEGVRMVVEGDTLWSIAREYTISPAELASRNGLSPDAQLAAGDTLVIPVSR
ncbi:MAG: LysM peptidoglycan-binding domain-containing protein [Dehalococcoidia bacterium]|nr:LysM peptidoglycan-binding domain-containing protein [Dehalococcoidia bacterium]